MVLLARDGVALWLLHVDLLLQVAVEEGRGGVELVDVPVVICSEGEEDAE